MEYRQCYTKKRRDIPWLLQRPLASGMVDYLLPDSIPNCGYCTHQSMDLPDHRLTPGASALTPAGYAS